MSVENLDLQSGSPAGYVDLQSNLPGRKKLLRQAFDGYCQRFDVPYPDDIANDHAKLSMDYAEGIARSFYGFSADLEAEATIGRSLIFGMALRRALAAPNVTILDESLLARYSSGEGSAEELTELTLKYLRGRTKIHNFVGHYLPKLAPNPIYADSSQATVGMLLWQHDEIAYQNYIDAQVSSLSPEIDSLETWANGQQ